MTLSAFKAAGFELSKLILRFFKFKLIITHLILIPPGSRRTDLATSESPVSTSLEMRIWEDDGLSWAEGFAGRLRHVEQRARASAEWLEYELAQREREGIMTK